MSNFFIKNVKEVSEVDKNFFLKYNNYKENYVSTKKYSPNTLLKIEYLRNNSKIILWNTF